MQPGREELRDRPGLTHARGDRLDRRSRNAARSELSIQKQTDRHERYSWIPALMVIAAFGPYLFGGVRTEQIAVYALVLPALLRLSRIAATPRLVLLIVLWAALASVSVVGAFVPPYLGGTPWQAGSLVAGMDNFLLPLAVMVVLGTTVTDAAAADRLIRSACGWVVACMCLNTLAAIAQTRGVEWTAWWSSEASGTVTALLAEQNGRYSGLINQPAEAGFLYGLAILAAFHRYGGRPLTLTGMLAVLSTGGALTVSKTFLLIGLPLLVLELCFRGDKRARRLLVVGGAAVGVAIFLGTRLVSIYPGVRQLSYLTNPSEGQSLLSVLSAQRYGEGADSGALFSATLESQPLFGFGAAGLDVPLDSAYVATLVYSGLVGLILFAAAFWLLLKSWFTADRGPVRHLLGMFLILLVASNFGIPTLTANRVSTVAWVFLSLLMIASFRHPARGEFGSDEQVPGDRPRGQARYVAMRPGLQRSRAS